MKQKRAFSKTLLIQESVLLWIMTLVFLYLAYMSIDMGYTGSLPWLSAMVSFPWAAYAVSAGFYYSKSKAENTVGGITYESAFKSSNAATDVLTVDKLDGGTPVSADELDGGIPVSAGAEKVYNKATQEDVYESGTVIEKYPDMKNGTVNYDNLNVDPWGPI